MKYKLEITISGESRHDLVLAIEQVQKSVEEGYDSGGDGNDDGNYYFNLRKEEMPHDPTI